MITNLTKTIYIVFNFSKWRCKLEPNLLITFDPVHEESAKLEIDAAVKETGKKAEIVKTEDGLAELNTENARELIKALKTVDKGKFNYTFYWWPVDEWCKSKIEDMQKCIKKIQEGIKADEKWKMDLAKRKEKQEYPKDLIIKLTDAVDKPKVDLKNPDKIIKVEIIGDKAAISLLAPEEIFNTKA